ncbi:MAG TPA: fluoride efflux transporter CrcB [Acidisarcina sp.]
MKYLWIGLGGALGAISRYAVGVWLYERLGSRFPYGTFAVNISGCFAVGLIVAFLDARSAVPSAWRYAVPIGFIGAYTTFSTFELESFHAVQDGFPGVALLNIILSVVIGYAAVWLGFAAGRHFA